MQSVSYTAKRVDNSPAFCESNQLISEPRMAYDARSKNTQNIKTKHACAHLEIQATNLSNLTLGDHSAEADFRSGSDKHACTRDEDKPKNQRKHAAMTASHLLQSETACSALRNRYQRYSSSGPVFTTSSGVCPGPNASIICPKITENKGRAAPASKNKRDERVSKTADCAYRQRANPRHQQPAASDRSARQSARASKTEPSACSNYKKKRACLHLRARLVRFFW